MSEGYFKGKVAGRIQMIDELITVIRILEGEWMAKKHKVAVYELKDSQGEYIWWD